MKTHLLGNVGKGPGQFHQGHAGHMFGEFLLAHGWMTSGESALFLLGRRVRTEGLLVVVVDGTVGLKGCRRAIVLGYCF